MSETSNWDVLVIGAGPVGLASALGLARQGLSVKILDQANALNRAPRAMAYPYPALEALENLGVLEDLKQQAYIGLGCGFIDFETGEQFPQSLDVLEGYVDHPYALQLGQGDVGEILIAHATRHGVDLQWNAKLTALAQDDSGVSISYVNDAGESTQLRAKYLIGADGASSKVRELLNLEFKGFTWPDRFVSTNIRYNFEDFGLPNAAWRIHEKYGAVIARIDKTDLWRYTFRESADLPVESLEQRIHEHYKTGLYGGDYQLVSFAPYRMHQRCVDNFRIGRVLLAGDAAHVTNPVGGLGLSGGFMDAYTLSDALGAVLNGQANEVVLDFYAARRKEVYTNIVSPVATMLKNMLFDPPADPQQRQAMFAGLRALSNNKNLLREDLLKQRALFTPSVVTPSMEMSE